MSPDGNGWPEHQRLVLHELRRISDAQDDLRGEVADLRADVAGLKVTAGLAGGLSGLVGAVVAGIMQGLGGQR